MVFFREFIINGAKRFGSAILCGGFIFICGGDAANAQTQIDDCAKEVCQAFDDEDGKELEPQVSRLESDDGCVDPVTKKEEKKFGMWGTVKRPGVLTPVTTLYNSHTRETLPIFEFPAVKPLLLQHFFRCRGFGETIEMAPELLESILGAAKHFKSTRVTIISGYRSPKFNDALAKKGRRVATESRHMRGQAIDFRLNSADATKLGNWLKENFEGGVGTYKNDNFVHIDVGPKRSWAGH